MKTRIKINALVISIALILCIFFPYVLIRRAEGYWDDVLEEMGILLVMAGMLLRISARGYKAEHSANGNELVTGGPYSLVRNPMYLGIVISGSGVVLVIGQWWGLFLFLGGFFLQYLYLFGKEEKILEHAFGQTYREYTKRVPRIIPALSAWKRDIREFLPLKLQWVRRELVSIVLIFVVVLVMEGWEEISFHGWPGMFQGLPKFLVVLACMIAFSAYLIINAKTYPNK